MKGNLPMPNGKQYSCECGSTEFEVWSNIGSYWGEFTMICTRCSKQIHEEVEG